MADFDRFIADGFGSNINRHIKSMHLIQEETPVDSLNIDVNCSIVFSCHCDCPFGSSYYVNPLEVGSNVSGAPNIYPLIVVEFYSRSIKSKQQGFAGVSNTPTDYTINAVNVDNCLVVGVGARLYWSSDTYFTHACARTILKNSTTVTLSTVSPMYSGSGKNSGVSGLNVGWVCLEFVGGVIK